MYMKSQVIQIRNIPSSENRPYFVHVKPTMLLNAFIIFGAVCMIAKTATAVVWSGLWFALIGLYGQLFLPDRILAAFAEEYMILFNRRGKECTIIYYDEIVRWSYEYHHASDELILTMVDGTTYATDLYSKRSIMKPMNLYLKGKEFK